MSLINPEKKIPAAVQQIQSPTPTGLMRVLTSMFSKKTTDSIQPDQPDPIHEQDSEVYQESDLINFWLNKYNLIQSIPPVSFSHAEKQEALNNLTFYLTGQIHLTTARQIACYKTLLLDPNFAAGAIQYNPNFFQNIPREVITDRLFILHLHKYSPDLLVLLSVALIREFTPVKLFDPIESRLKNTWICVEHLRDGKIVVTKEIHKRIYIDALDVWLLNPGWISEKIPGARLSSETLEKFGSLRASSDFIQPTPTPSTPSMVSNDIHKTKVTSGFQTADVSEGIEELSDHDLLEIQDDDTLKSHTESDSNPKQNESEYKVRSMNGFMKLEQCVVGKQFGLHHPSKGWIDVILTGIHPEEVEFVIYSGDMLGCKTRFPIDFVSSCLILGDPNSRILNTNVIRVKT